MLVFLQGSGSLRSSSSKRPGLTPGAGGGDEVGAGLAGSPFPGRRGPGGQQHRLCRPQGPCPFASSPDPPGNGGKGRAKGEGMGVCKAVPVSARSAVPLPSLARGRQRTVLRGAVFSETAGDVVCVKLALPC